MVYQSWRTTQFTDEHEDSIVTVTLDETNDGTLLTFVHSDVPDGQTSYEQSGWQEHYFEPMKEYFASRKQAGFSDLARCTAFSRDRKSHSLQTSYSRHS